MKHDLLLSGPSVSLRPLTVEDAADLVRVTTDSPDVAADLRWHTSPLRFLMLTHAFEVWGCVRVALRCDAGNERSAAAIRRLGAIPEGVLRNHRRRHDGSVGDTAYFSITQDDWPAVRAGLRARSEP